jgi:hypothetical protein
MESSEIIRALSVLGELQVTTAGDRLVIYVPAIDDSVHLFAPEVMRAEKIFAPTGDPAVEFTMGDGNNIWPLILTGTDAVYAPASPDDLLDASIRFTVSDAPHLVAYSEMDRDAETTALACAAPGPVELDGLSGNLLLLRCFIAGAARFGLRPVRAVAWWQRGRQSLGDDFMLPSFRPDAVWNELARDAAGIKLTGSLSRNADDAPAVTADLAVADFEALEPMMTPVRLDEEFVESWREWIPLSPTIFAQTLMKGVPEARSDVALYPEGGGTIDLRCRRGDAVVALLQLRFSIPESVLTIDEIRIGEQATGTGLFQRLIFNTEQLAARLGLRELKLLATGIGSYALAKVGVYPRNPEFRRNAGGQA